VSFKDEGSMKDFDGNKNQLPPEALMPKALVCYICGR